MTESLDDHLRADHERLDLLLERIRRDVEVNDRSVVAAAREFSKGLRRHISFEEESLFPALKGVAGRPSDRAFESLLIDHAVILEHLDLLLQLVERGDSAAARPVADKLEIYLQGHNREEESGVYRDAERLIPERDRATLIAKLPAAAGGTSS